MWVPDGEVHLFRLLSKDEIRGTLQKGGLGLVNVFDFDCKETTSYWYVIKDSFGSFEELSPKMRNQVKKSLKVYECERVERSFFMSNALPIFNKALSNYKVKAEPLSIERFNEISKAWPNNTDFWFVYYKETHELVALAVDGVYEDSVQYWIMKADPEYMHNSTYPYYGLIYQMNEYYLQELGKRYVSDGARTLTQHSNIQDFLISKFNFRKAYCHPQIVWKKWMRPIIGLLYVFRGLIKTPKITALLNLEKIRRGLEI